MSKRIVLLSAALAILVAGGVPLLAMLAKSLTADGHFSFQSYRDLLNPNARHWLLLKNSVVLASSTSLVATLIGLPLGIVLGKTDLPMRRLFAVLFAIPLLIPPYIVAISWFYLLGKDGAVGSAVPTALAESLSAWLFGLPGCIWVLSSVFVPIVMLLAMVHLQTINPRLEEAGRLVGGWPAVLKHITLPLIRPGVAFAAILVFLLALGEVGVPAFLRYPVFPLETLTQFSAFYNAGAATAAAVPLVIIVFLLLLAERHFLGETHFQLYAAARSMPSIELKAWRTAILALVGMLCFITAVAPVSVLAIQSASLSIYAEAISKAGGSILRSLAFAAIGASCLMLLGFFCGYLVYHKSLRIWRGVDSLTLFLFILPGTVVGIGLISLWNRPSTNVIYATPLIIILGYMAQYTALTSRITASTLGQIPESMEEAAQMVGAGWLERIRTIVAPLAKPALVGGWLVSYIFCLRDLNITITVYPPGADTLPVRIFTLMANGPSELISSLCIIMIVITLVPLGILAAYLEPAVR